MKQRTGSMNWTGWMAAALLAGALVAGGFQNNTDKSGVVDLTKVLEQSAYGKANKEEFNKLKASRESLLRFIGENSVLTLEQAQKIRELWLKPAPTEAEKAELARVKGEVEASAARAKELAGKGTLTPDERTLLDEFVKRGQTMRVTAQRWLEEFSGEMQDWADDRKELTLQRARSAVQQVARSQGYTLVFDTSVAPYGANDLTDAALQAMDAIK